MKTDKDTKGLITQDSIRMTNRYLVSSSIHSPMIMTMSLIYLNKNKEYSKTYNEQLGSTTHVAQVYYETKIMSDKDSDGAVIIFMISGNTNSDNQTKNNSICDFYKKPAYQ